MKTKVILCTPNVLQARLQDFFDAKHAEKVDIEIINTQQTLIPPEEGWAPRLVYTIIYTETSFAEYVDERPERELTQEDFNRWQNPDTE